LPWGASDHETGYELSLCVPTYKTLSESVSQRKGHRRDISELYHNAPESRAKVSLRTYRDYGNDNGSCRLHHEVVKFVSDILPTPQEKAARHRAYKAITNVIQRRFPKAEVDLFGSVAYDLCLPDRSVGIAVPSHIQVDAINWEQRP
jgi:DNA polymerase sigma